MSELHKIAFVFPGQGSQSLGMMNALVDDFPCVRETFEEASAVLGKDLWNLVTTGPETELNQTENTQPVMLTAGIATWRAWCQAGGTKPAYMAGHSLGEYSALVAAGAISFADGIRLAAERARLMQAAVPMGQGAMAAVLGLADEAVQALCEACAEGEVLAAVNYNAPGQIVVAGTQPAVARLQARASEAGARKVVLLPVSVPSHCALMQPAAEALAVLLDKISLQLPEIPVFHNVTAQPATSLANLRELLVKQVCMPVRWVETIQNMQTNGVRMVIECGPGKVLAGLNKRIDKALANLTLNSSDTINTALTAVAEKTHA